MVNFPQIISSSLEWTAAVLFRPFSPKKWLILGLVALLAGQMAGGGCNTSFNPRLDNKAKTGTKTADVLESGKSAVKKSPPASQPIHKRFDRVIKDKKLLAMLIALFALLTVLFTWLYARFTFIFIADTVRNEFLIKLPFKKYRQVGNSLFIFNIFFGLFWLSALISMAFMLFLRFKSMGFFSGALPLQPLAVLLAALPYISALLIFLLAAGLVYLIVRDFVQVIMFKDGLNFVTAWKKSLNILGKNINDFILYILVRIGLGICAWVASSIVYMIISLAVLMQGAFIILAAAFLYKLLPVSLHMPYAVGFIILAAPVLAFLAYCFICAYLPFAVFYRTFSLKFMASIAPEYNLFAKYTENGGLR